MKSAYNERFSFTDPSAPLFSSRATRHRMKNAKEIRVCHQYLQGICTETVTLIPVW